MKCTRYLAAGASVLAIAAMASLSAGASAHTYFFPYKKGSNFRLDPTRPLVHAGSLTAPFKAPKGNGGTWTDVKAKLPFADGPWNPKQLTDGTVIFLDFCTVPAQWYKLSPDKTGSYVNGTWSKISTMPSGYSPLFFASEVLTDGRFIMNGGEYNASNNGVCGGQAEYKGGALYDPVNDSWTSVSPPSGWVQIGDAESAILPDGSYMLADCCGKAEAIATISGTTVTWTTTGTGKVDDNNEEGWGNLPNGDIFDVDVFALCNPGDHYETYDPSHGAWTEAGSCTTDTLTIASTRELGPAPLTPEYGKSGTIIQFSGNPTLGVNDIYDVASDTWKSGPVMTFQGVIYDVADGPAATLPDGDILIDASPSTFQAPSHFWDWRFNKKNGKLTVTQVSDPTQAPGTSSFEGNLMVLPTGQVVWDDSQTSPNEVSIYTDGGKPSKNWLPVVSSVAKKLKVGSTGNAISGTNFNGFDLGGSYGDDAQQSTNFPLVRFTNTKTGDVCFGRSYNFSTMGVWTTGTTNAAFDIPKSCDTGVSKLQVIVNGIASTAVKVTLS
jgi:hypothetical protein